MALPTSRPRLVPLLAACVVAAGGAAFVLIAAAREPARATREASAPAGGAALPRHAVHVRRPGGPPRLATGLLDEAGHEVTVGCSTCHATRLPERDRRDGSELTTFHLGMTSAHGSLTCTSCHQEPAYDSLRLADGASLPYVEVMTLCGQCHGPQARDYAHGAHGGMTGHWDLTRGPRARNNCIDCHDPHAPAYPEMVPAPGPRDRFAAARPHGVEGGEEHP